LPPLKPCNAARARQDRIIAMGKRGMTIREIGRVLAMSQTHRVIWGTPQSIADDLTEWYEPGRRPTASTCCSRTIPSRSRNGSTW
jgi:alkanesulfonate monooxygenase SsuD/methylene tetrahydromethanopterin reductase-like flavin-dependent oxidoreductase (luciferase family)